jgi:5'-3' exonuclease
VPSLEKDEDLLDDLKKKTRRPNRGDILKAKELLDACGLHYIQPSGEADEVCVALVNKNIVYACLSNDTDMFALGCKRIMKNFNIVSPIDLDVSYGFLFRVIV